MPLPDAKNTRLASALNERFGENIPIPANLKGTDELLRIAAHRVHREYSDHPVSDELVEFVCAMAFSAPSKSDLQQRDIVVVRDPETRKQIASFLPHMPHVGDAPAFLVFCANGQRLPELAKLRGKPFPNDHLDLFFNAAVDAGIALVSAMRAAEAIGLGCCPVSEIRNEAALVSELLGLPSRVIPLAGFCLGWPKQAGQISPRLPLSLTLHVDRFQPRSLDAAVTAYDRRRDAIKPYAKQRDADRWGEADFYGWSEDVTRQYAKPERATFGAFVRARGFKLD